MEGTILSLNGDSVRKATVRLQGTAGQPGQPPTSYSETTDNGGKFVFDDVAPGRYTLSADKPGFVAARYGARSNTSAGTQFALTAGMEMKDLVIKMTQQGVIAGKVLDQDGDPVVSVQVQAMRSAYVTGRKQLQSVGGTATNDLGEYRLINLAPGRYVISASDPRGARMAQDSDLRSGKIQEATITTFYPNATNASGAVGVDVAAGGEIRGMDIRLLQAKVYTVRGKAVNASALAGAPAILSLTRKDDNTNLPAILNGGASGQLRPDGTFEFRNVLPGTYVLQLGQIILNGNQSDVVARMEVSVANANIDGLELPLVRRPEITGTMKLEDGDIASLVKPAQNPAGVAIIGNVGIAQLSRARLILTPIEGGPGSTPNAQVKEDGSFRFESVGLAKYALNGLPMGQGTYLKSARFGGQDVLHAPIDTTSGTGGTLELVLSSKVASITGSVHNEKGDPSTGTMVTLWPKTPDASPTGGTRGGFTDQNGAFKFQGLPPGDYFVAAWEDVDQGLLQSIDFLNHFTSDAAAITLAEGGQESRDLKPVPADKVALEIAKLQ